MTTCRQVESTVKDVLVLAGELVDVVGEDLVRSAEVSAGRIWLHLMDMDAAPRVAWVLRLSEVDDFDEPLTSRPFSSYSGPWRGVTVIVFGNLRPKGIR